MRSFAIILALLMAAPAPAAAFFGRSPVQIVSPSSLGAGYRPQQDQARDAVRRGKQVSLERVEEKLRRRTRGQMLDAGLEERGGRSVYRVRWAASDGRRIDYIVDAETNNILSAVGE